MCTYVFNKWEVGGAAWPSSGGGPGGREEEAAICGELQTARGAEWLSNGFYHLSKEDGTTHCLTRD